jgi:hypothetical protein
VTVIDGHQFIPNPFVIGDGHGGHQQRQAGFYNGTPTHVRPEILAALIEHAGELEALLKAGAGGRADAKTARWLRS